jgi:hypothetical protein
MKLYVYEFGFWRTVVLLDKKGFIKKKVPDIYLVRVNANNIHLSIYVQYPLFFFQLMMISYYKYILYSSATFTHSQAILRQGRSFNRLETVPFFRLFTHDS